jgi:hypothetical protein
MAIARGVLLACATLLAPLLAPLATPPSAAHAADAGYQISGEVSFPGSGTLYLELCTRAEFEGKRRCTSQTRILVDDKLRRARRASFSFRGVPRGSYAVRGYQDANGNGKLDSGTFGPKEPWGTYRPKRPLFRGPRFDEISFPLERSLGGVALELR